MQIDAAIRLPDHLLIKSLLTDYMIRKSYDVKSIFEYWCYIDLWMDTGHLL